VVSDAGVEGRVIIVHAARPPFLSAAVLPCAAFPTILANGRRSRELRASPESSRHRLAAAAVSPARG
jgi:hypothetical protein